MTSEFRVGDKVRVVRLKAGLDVLGIGHCATVDRLSAFRGEPIAFLGGPWAYLWQLERVHPCEPESPSPQAVVRRWDSDAHELGYWRSLDQRIADVKRPVTRSALDERFGPRPGIDDTGGGSGPGWEE